ncbi:ribosomal protein L23 [Methanobacterium lacus]|jgi:large subunit ribosomal protein L23|uniref:Large ribosomal subunit protein uL23 n=1 Tax=Methanobacterium lacus (strain AL-21) TaxID=877455 RepID=F0TB76_METLA|nr:50S ribosomal protein L23 [Methanobacterium lacus]ADZ09027.1 ribosomal protein L23 [Methanobacterium lacus]
MDAYKVLIKPHLTEKSMNSIDQKNELTFVVLRTANKTQIKSAFESLYDVKVMRVNTQILNGQKLAYIKLSEDDSAEDIAVKMGVF